MEQQRIQLSSSEMGSLWGTYIQESMSECLLKYFLHHLRDEEIKAILQKALQQSQSHQQHIRQIFIEEDFPVPEGFSDNDIDLTVPPLFHDPFALSFIYMTSRLGMINSPFALANVARPDILSCFSNFTAASIEIFTESVKLMLSKGIYDRPPKIEYPKKVEYIQRQSYMTGFIGNKRPLNAVELTELFFNIERNYFGIILSMGLLQVIKDKEIKQYFQKGKKICEKQVHMFNDLLKDEDHLGLVPVTMEVTDSTMSPFSDKLIMTLFHFLNSLDIMLLGHALSLSMRTDLAAHYAKLIGEILLYAEDGYNIMINRGWMEQPPQAINRKALMKR